MENLNLDPLFWCVYMCSGGLWLVRLGRHRFQPVSLHFFFRMAVPKTTFYCIALTYAFSHGCVPLSSCTDPVFLGLPPSSRDTLGLALGMPTHPGFITGILCRVGSIARRQYRLCVCCVYNFLSFITHNSPALWHLTTPHTSP